MTLTPSNHNGFAITCFGAKDGQLTANVSGGTPPYTYSWSHGDSTQQVVGLAAGFYRVTVHDADTLSGTAEITLMEPLQLRVDLVPYVYPNAYNISCADCFNGAIQSSVSGGLTPYQYQWNDDVTTAHRQDLGHHVNYELSVTDANGCIARSQILSLTQPERMDWTMEGNNGTDPEQHYIGTADSTDLVLKSHGQEMVRLKSDGEIVLAGSLTGTGLLVRGATGAIGLLQLDQAPATPCALDVLPLWTTAGNQLLTCGGCEGFLGSMDECPLRIVTDAQERIIVHGDGRTHIKGPTGIGLDPGGDPFAAYPSLLNLNAENGQWLRLSDGNGKRWRLMSYEEPDGPEGIRFHFTDGPYPPQSGAGPLVLFEDGGLRAGPSMRVHANGKVSIGDVSTDTPDYAYQLYVEGGILTERAKVALKTGTEWSDHVFLSSYQLMPLPEVKAFIEEHGHLPGVPSAEQMVEQGLDVVKTDAMLLEKIEELTLHAIAMNSRLEEAERIIADLLELLARTKQ